MVCDFKLLDNRQIESSLNIIQPIFFQSTVIPRKQKIGIFKGLISHYPNNSLPSQLYDMQIIKIIMIDP